jgi:crotonobetainyl-CoA:carnitine CoA-transferase CaiB-like acyl-CoA transferase
MANASSLPAQRGALSHVRVLDMSRVVAGPWAAQPWPISAPT